MYVMATFVMLASVIGGSSSFQSSRSAKTASSSPCASAATAKDFHASCVVERCVDAWNQRDLDSVIECFTEDCEFDDLLFEGKCATREELRKRIQSVVDSIPSLQVTVDELANDPRSGKIGVRWHLETDVGFKLPFSRGCSFFTTNQHTGLIKNGFQVMESPLKPDYALFDTFILPTKLLETILPSAQSNEELEGRTFRSIVEKAYYHWNQRDMTAASNCFMTNVQYEDTLYVNTISGRNALRKHLERVSEQVPAICKIVVDDFVKCPYNGNIAVRWHLEVESNQLLSSWSRGCSMYTTDPETGLITSGIDVTESPVKVNENRFYQLLFPFRMINGWKG